MNKYYKFDNSDVIAKRDGAFVYTLDENGEWVSRQSLFGKFVGGDCDYDEISEAEVETIIQKRKGLITDVSQKSLFDRMRDLFCGKIESEVPVRQVVEEQKAEEKVPEESWLDQIRKDLTECKIFIARYELRHGNLLNEHEILPNEVVLEFVPSAKGFRVFNTDENAAICGEAKIFDDNYCGSLRTAFRFASECFRERLVELNNIDDAAKEKYVHPIGTGRACHPLCCYMCGVHLDINGSTPLRKQKHEDSYFFETEACRKCNEYVDKQKPQDLIFKLKTPAGTRGYADQACYRYYIDFSAGNIPKILDVRKIGDDGKITEDCYVLPSEMQGTAMFTISNCVNSYVCFVGNPLYHGLYEDYVNGKSGFGIYDRSGYPMTNFYADDKTTDVLFLNKEVIDNIGFADCEVCWGNRDLRFHYMDLWNQVSKGRETYAVYKQKKYVASVDKDNTHVMLISNDSDEVSQGFTAVRGYGRGPYTKTVDIAELSELYELTQVFDYMGKTYNIDSSVSGEEFKIYTTDKSYKQYGFSEVYDYGRCIGCEKEFKTAESKLRFVKKDLLEAYRSECAASCTN